MNAPRHLPLAMPRPLPTAAQLDWQRLGLGMFCHFGINTFFGKEWSDGRLPAAGFNPHRLDPRQWARAARAAGCKHLVLTAKHHDGFCLWPTATTAYSVASSPWKDGKGDVVAEVAEACRAEGLALGLYLSPWDRNHPAYPDAAAYDDVYCRQLTELCTRYGELVELWFDGAGSEGRTYDWQRIMAVAHAHQPRAVIFNMGKPTIRWAGNENGVVDEPVRYHASTAGALDFCNGKREDPAGHDVYIPPECDVAIRQHWFWQGDDLATLKSEEHLLAIWYRSVGLGANLLLNLPPDRDGLLDEVDVARLHAMTDEVRRRFAAPFAATIAGGPLALSASFDRPATIDHIELREDLRAGQRIDRVRVLADDGAVLLDARSVGARRIQAFPTRTVRRLRIELEGAAPRLESVNAYRTDHERLPELGKPLDYNAFSAKVDPKH